MEDLPNPFDFEFDESELASDLDELEVDDVPSTAGLSIALEFEISRVWKKVGKPYEEVFVAGRYRLERRVGIGSYGRVYEATDLELDRRVAVKVMALGDPAVADREGKALAALDHPNVVRIIDRGQHADYRWLILDFLDGPKLSDWCQERPPAREIIARYLEAGQGLDAAHRRGLVHRDFKPGNIMLHRGRAVVTDFGLARNAESLNGYESEQLIASGTIQFMSRERLRGSPGDERSDQFAFCVSLWWALTGEFPFGPATGLESYYKALEGPTRGGGAIKRRVRKVLKRGMAVVPGERWPSVATLVAELDDAASPRGWSWLGGLLVLGLTSTALAVKLMPVHQLHVEYELSKLDAAALEVVEQVDKKDATKTIGAVTAGYLEARARKEQRRFVGIAKFAAKELEELGYGHEAIDAWWMVRHLYLDLGDREQAFTADENRRKIEHAL
ncbi:serine/threonine kinase PKN8 [Plesiocystis pacifica SIR-1]|uniref:Serine/threonine kinase PKN8 n=1 Tax=Plesiocystis pacifica SIR-1 TaxID=391625 RepID=A6GDY8_9BACT|nr:serine/threonine-protein kinase [Plesiocystis pacifica]EDM75937.1 serine/threonine kinase PKN8 [Plesiocystis pacifica SIR-1]